jgi:hypothetical protein
MLGVPAPLPWRQDADALVITIPADIERSKPCAQAYAFKIEVERPVENGSGRKEEK